MNRPPPQDFPWTLRLVHEGMLSLRVERKGRRLRFDPLLPVEAGDISILTGAWPEQVDAARAAAAAGQRPTLVAPAALSAHVAQAGPVDDLGPRALIDELTIESEPYTPIPYATPREALFKARSALLRPDRAAARLLRRARSPRTPPQVTHITFPDGRRLLHLHLALHSGTPADWLDRATARWSGADWLIAGVDHGEDEAVLGHLGRFSPKKVLLTDLTSEVRRSLGLPTHLLTPTVDTARDRGLDAYIVVSGASMRFE